MGFSEAIRSAFINSVVWRGRARRAEFWYFQLFVLIVYSITILVDISSGVPVLSIVAWLVFVLPSIAVTVRRLHDTGRSGWWFWISLVPFVGGLVLLAFLIVEGDPAPNHYGPSPKYVLA